MKVKLVICYILIKKFPTKITFFSYNININKLSIYIYIYIYIEIFFLKYILEK